LEHRYLVALFLLNRLPGARLVFVASQRPSVEMVDHYLSMFDPEVAPTIRDRFQVVVVDDPSPRAVAAKALDDPAAMASLRQAIGNDPAVIEPWNVDRDEAALACALGVPVNGAAPRLRSLGFKSAGRRLMAESGVPVPFGVEDVSDVDGVVEAALGIIAGRPRASGAVVKLDDSGAGDGNLVIDFRSLPSEATARARALRDIVSAFPDWYLRDLASGAVVEERITGDEFSSPSAQIDMKPDGSVTVLSTHEQELGGDDGVVYLGCRFPAHPDYASTLARHAKAVGERLASKGAIGRAAIDFVAARNMAGWEVAAVEINLRKGGTTHPFTALRHLTGGRYDPTRGQWRLPDGSTRVYVASDNFLDPTWRTLSERTALAAVTDAGLTFQPSTKVGVVLHMLPGLSIDGRCGIIAIGRNHDAADTLVQQTRAAFHSAITNTARGGGL
jgi:hypothetical protein